jgi:putative membrane protein
VSTADEPDPDYRFSLANERTFLAWVRTALALLAGGVAAAKALEFHHALLRWVVAGPPIAAGALRALHATLRWRTYEDAMRRGSRLPVGRGLKPLGIALCVYALVALVASALDG